MSGIKLSARLQAIAGMVTEGSFVYDVGCDHGFLDIYLVEKGAARGAIASDVGRGPLMRAEAHIAEAGLSDRIRTVLSDGLKNVPIPDAGSALVISGMGGMLILKIFSESPEVLSGFDEIVISPQSDIDLVRETLNDYSLHIISEKMVYEDGHFYTIIKITGGACPPPEKKEKEFMEYAGSCAERIMNRYGLKLICGGSGVLKEFLKHEKATLEGIEYRLRSSGHNDRYEQILTDIGDNELTFQWMEGVHDGYDQD